MQRMREPVTIAGHPVEVETLGTGEVRLWYRPWAQCGRGPTLEAALEDLLASQRARGRGGAACEERGAR